MRISQILFFSKKRLALICLLPMLAMQWSCAGLDPRKVEAPLKETLPSQKTTSYTQALGDLGLMTDIYGAPSLKIQCNPIGDNTGTSAATGGEIPRDITEMMKSSLNAIGGKVVFIPYDPSFIQNQVVTGYGNFNNKVIPDVILTGGITEFDRGLETRGENTDVSAGGEFEGLPADMPSRDVDLRYGSAKKSGLARITLDFNLLDFQTMTGISKMNTVNSMEVRKVLRDNELGISLFGQTFGGKGNVKKVQGRHAAVRLLVELSMIQIVGKHLRLPYWRLLGKDAQPDKLVMEQMATYYRLLTDVETITNIQEWLYLYGYDLEINGQLDDATKAALQAQAVEFDAAQPRVDFSTFCKIYLNIPITPEAKLRRETAGWNN